MAKSRSYLGWLIFYYKQWMKWFVMDYCWEDWLRAFWEIFQEYPVEIMCPLHIIGICVIGAIWWGNPWLWLWLWIFSGPFGSLQGISKALIRWNRESETARWELKRWFSFWPLFWIASAGFIMWFIVTLKRDPIHYPVVFIAIGLGILWIVLIFSVAKLYPFSKGKVEIFIDIDKE